MTEQRIIETFGESGKYEEALALLEKTQQIDDELIDSVLVKVITVNPDHSTTLEQVRFNRRFEIVTTE